MIVIGNSDHDLMVSLRHAPECALESFLVRAIQVDVGMISMKSIHNFVAQVVGTLSPARGDMIAIVGSPFAALSAVSATIDEMTTANEQTSNDFMKTSWT